MFTPAEQLAEFVHGLRYGDIPGEVRASAAMRLVDTVGVGLATHDMPYARSVADLAVGWGGVEESTVLAGGQRIPAPNAILANGTMVGGVDYDDTHGEAMVHASACNVPTALAMAEKVGANGEALITALVAGLELQTRIGAAAQGNLHVRGFHATFVTGAFATAATAGKLLGLSQKQLTNAIAVAGTQASGSFEWLVDGSWAKRFGTGWAGHSGTIAALLAERGYSGPPTIFEGDRGFYKSHLGEGNYDVERITRGLGSEWETPKIMAKRHPSCHATHSGINAAMAIKRQHSFGADDIAEVECIFQPDMVQFVAEPKPRKMRPDTAFQAQFSIYYTLAVTLLRGGVDIMDFTEEGIADTEVLRLAERVRYTVNEENRRNPHLPATVIVRLRDGREFRETDWGDRDHPMTSADVAEKFRRNVRRSLSAEQGEMLLRSLTEVASAPSIRELMALTVVSRAGK